MSAELKIEPHPEELLATIREAAQHDRTRPGALQFLTGQTTIRDDIRQAVERREAELEKWRGWLTIAEANVQAVQDEIGGIEA